MNVMDFIIGLTLVNALPHLTLGIWKGRMLSGLGIGNTQNILYSLVNVSISLGLFLYQYGLDGLWENGIYLGGLFVAVMYYLTGKLFYTLFHKRFYDRQDQEGKPAI